MVLVANRFILLKPTLGDIMTIWKEILKVDYEEIEKGWPFPKKNNTQPHVTIEYTQEQQDKINAFSTARGVTAKQAGSWLTRNNWNLPQDALVEFRQLR